MNPVVRCREENRRIMQEGSGYVDLKHDVSIHEGLETQYESTRRGLHRYMKVKRLRMSRSVGCMCQYMLCIRLRMSRSMRGCVDSCCAVRAVCVDLRGFASTHIA